MKPNRRLLGWLLTGLVWLGCGRSQSPLPTSDAQGPLVANTGADPEGDDWASAVNAARAKRDLVTAERILRQRLIVAPADSLALERLADILVQRGQIADAIELYQAAIASSSHPSNALLDKAIEQRMRTGKPFETMALLRQAIQLYPDRSQLHYDLVGIATMVGLTDQVLPSLQWLAQTGRADADTLIVLADPGRVEPDGAMCEQLLRQHPGDLRPNYGLAQLDAMQLKWREVAQRLDPVCRQQPDFVPAQILYARALIELGDDQQLQTWQQQLPAQATESPDYWLIAGMWAQRQGQHDQAVDAFLTAIADNELAHTQTLPRLLLALQQCGRADDADRVAQQIRRLGQLHDALQTHFERGGRSQQAALAVAESLEQLGRLWESEGWARLAASLPDQRLSDIRQRYLAIRSQLTATTPWQLPQHSIAASLDAADLDAPDADAVQWTLAAGNATSPVSAADRQLQFDDQAAQRGLIHTCAIASQAATEGHWIYQSVGGGIAVIDYDLDGWPDLAAAMLDGTPLHQDSSVNRLFRNLQGTFVETGAAANYRDTGFAQGLAVGDYNDDGFPDLLDANIGRNRLYRNNGDGTFTDVTDDVGINDAAWTTSVCIADVDGDGVADLYETNYCRGPAPFNEPCHNDQGISTCPPLRFDAEPDRLWRGLGDGTFADASAELIADTEPGRGLGVVVGSLDERPGLDLYVANDMTVNHLWSGELSDDGFRLQDLAAVRGVAASGRSLSQASMGIAVADADQDGDTDFFLTHFSDDHNTYYEQVGPGLWTDRSFQVGLAEPSMKLLGFGTQWADFDADGSLELIVANGHVDDVGRQDVGYRMPPQLFTRAADGQWHQQPGDALGDYFAGEHLGRALVTLDADRDGQLDVAITHLYDPVALLINRTASAGNLLRLELKATAGQRDAIGATVQMRIGGRPVTAQLTGGDGYMSSNQRCISIGTGSVQQVTDVVVTWRCGVTQHIGTLRSGQEVLIVESAQPPFVTAVHR